MKIILDTFYDYDEDLLNNNLCSNIIGGSWMCVLFSKAQEKGYRVLFAQTYIAQGVYDNKDLILSEGFTKHTKALLRLGATPFLLYSFESPNVDWSFFARIKKHSKAYQHVYLFKGLKQFLLPHTKFHEFFWVNNVNDVEHALLRQPSIKNNLLVMIASNKKQNSTTSGNLLLGIVKGTIIKVLIYIVPSIKLKDLYNKRMQAMVYFSNKPYFKLFGKGWDNTANLTSVEKAAVAKLEPQSIQSKVDVLKEYTFAICFENCVYPGYVTEKIFDCFFAGCIPVYYGAPDIANYVPTNTFVNAAEFKNFKVLEEFLTGMSTAEIEAYQKNIATFLKSQEMKKFTDVYFATKILTLLPLSN